MAENNSSAPLKTAEGAAHCMPEPDAWRYTGDHGIYRYRGKRAGFASDYQILKPEPLYTAEQMRAYAAQAVAAQAPAASDTNRLRAEILEHASKGSRLVRTLFNEPTGTLSDVEVGDWIQRAQQYLTLPSQAAPAAVAVPETHESLAQRLDAVCDSLEAIKLPPHNPTYAIEDILDEYEGDEREEAWESIKAYAEGQARGAVLIERKSRAATPKPPATENSSAGDLVEVHPDDAAVDALAAKMKAKLAKQRAKGYSGWDQPECSQQRLSAMLRDHVSKGDPVDVANFCAFLAARGEGIEAAVQAEPVALQMCSELKPRSESEKAAYLAGVADGRMYAERDADTAPQAKPADALDAKRWRAAAHDLSLKNLALVSVDDYGACEMLTGDEANEAIDAAMAAAQEGGNAAKEA